MNELMFSVIVPVYNVEKYLCECIDSILAQKYMDFELVLVDDGSTDTSGTICDKYALNDSRIKVIHKENGGLISARRAGLHIAAGQYICFVDADDMIACDLLQKIYAVISKFSSDIITFKWMNIDSSGKPLHEEAPVFPEGEVGKEVYFQKMLSSASLNSLCKKICRRTLFDADKDYSCFYSIRNGEDLLQTIPLVYRARSFYYLVQPLYLYRSNPDSITHRYRGDEYKVLNTVRPALFQCMVDLGYDSPENRNLFFGFYLSSIWQKLYSYCTNSTFEREVLDAIYAYPLVAESKKYCSKTKIRIRVGLKLFYSKHWNLMKLVFNAEDKLMRMIKFVK